MIVKRKTQKSYCKVEAKCSILKNKIYDQEVNTNLIYMSSNRTNNFVQQFFKINDFFHETFFWRFVFLALLDPHFWQKQGLFIRHTKVIGDWASFSFKYMCNTNCSKNGYQVASSDVDIVYDMDRLMKKQSAKLY